MIRQTFYYFCIVILSLLGPFGVARQTANLCFKPLVKHERLALPSRVRLAIEDGDAEKIFASNQRQWDFSQDLPQLRSTLGLVIGENLSVLSAQKLHELRSFRKRASRLRSAFYIFDKSHESPKSLKEWVSTFGDFKDAAVAKVREPIRETAFRLLAASWDLKPEEWLGKFEPCSAKSFRKYLKESFEDIQKSLDAASLSFEEYHDLRRALRDISRAARFIADLKNDPDLDRLARYVGETDDHLGARVDRAVERSIIQGREPTGDYTLSEWARHRIEIILDRIEL